MYCFIYLIGVLIYLLYSNQVLKNELIQTRKIATEASIEASEVQEENEDIKSELDDVNDIIEELEFEESY